jgi:hypothetical protein
MRIPRSRLPVPYFRDRRLPRVTCSGRRQARSRQRFGRDTAQTDGRRHDPFPVSERGGELCDAAQQLLAGNHRGCLS